jgi:hypothetical protein
MYDTYDHQCRTTGDSATIHSMRLKLLNPLLIFYHVTSGAPSNARQVSGSRRSNVQGSMNAGKEMMCQRHFFVMHYLWVSMNRW